MRGSPTKCTQNSKNAAFGRIRTQTLRHWSQVSVPQRHRPPYVHYKIVIWREINQRFIEKKTENDDVSTTPKLQIQKIHSIYTL